VQHTAALMYVIEESGGDQGLLSGMFTELKQRRPRLVLGWLTVKEDRVL